MFTSLRQHRHLLLLALTVLLVFSMGQQVMAQDQLTGEVELIGALEQVGNGFIVVSGQTISINGAEIKDPLTVGDMVKVHYSLVGGQAVAREVERAADDTPTTCTPTRPEGWVTYVIQHDDTLSEIALRTGSTVEELVRVNCITNRRLIQPGAEIFVPVPIDANNIAERCRLAGIEPERCRELVFGDDDQIAERCRVAGIEPERCRALFGDDDNNLAERCRLAGIEPERCRQLLFGDDNLVERCRLNEIEPERCRRLLFGDDDDSRGPGSSNSGRGSSDDHDDNDNGGSDDGHDDDDSDDDGNRGRGSDDSGGDDDDNDDNGGGGGRGGSDDD
jgi:LysM repeat protein